MINNASSNSSRKILLLSSVFPGDQNVGGVVLEDLSQLLPREQQIAFFCLASAKRKEVIAQTGSFPSPEKFFSAVQTSDRKYETISNDGQSRLRRAASMLTRKFRSHFHIKQTIQKAVAFGKEHQVTAIWSILDSYPTVVITSEVAKQLQVPLHSLVWDDAVYQTAAHKLDKFARTTFLNHFEQAMSLSQKVAVCGETMKDEYEKQFRKPCYVVRHATPRSLWLPIASSSDGHSSNAEAAPLRIGFAGWNSSPLAFESFLAALDQLGWVLNERPVTLRLTGAELKMKSRAPRHVEYLGWGTMEKTLTLLSESDFNYLPQPFSSSLERLAKFSFPNKVSTYTAAGRPLFLHAPQGASLGKFIERFPFAHWCDSTDVESVQKHLQEMASNANAMQKMTLQIEKAREEELNAETMHARFLQFIDV